MDSSLNKGFLAVIATVLSAALFFLGSGLHPVWWMAWLAPLPVYLLATRTSAVRTFAVAFFASAIGALNEWGYLREVTPPAVTVAVLVLPALLFAVVTLLFRFFAVRGWLLRAAFSAPAFTVAANCWYEAHSPHSTFGDPAYSQMNFLPILQIASITGIAGIGFLLQLVPAAIAASVAPRATRASRGAAIAVSGGILACALGFGIYRLHSDKSAPQVTAALLVTDERKTLSPRGKATVDMVQAYADRIPALAAEGAEVVVIPEKIGRIPSADLVGADRIFENAARTNHVTILAGFEHQPNLNEARLYAPDGTLEATYEKHHMLPAFEWYQLPGTARVTVQRPSGKWGVAICKDMDFPLLSRQYALDGAGLMLVPAWDFVTDGWLHGRMAVLRGVESGFSMARAPKQGILTLTDDRGRVLAEHVTGDASPGMAPFAALVGRIPVREEPTFYARHGDWFAWADFVLALALFIPVRRKVAPSRDISSK